MTTPTLKTCEHVYNSCNILVRYDPNPCFFMGQMNRSIDLYLQSIQLLLFRSIVLLRCCCVCDTEANDVCENSKVL